jgi:hypothetical protein
MASPYLAMTLRRLSDIFGVSMSLSVVKSWGVRMKRPMRSKRLKSVL